MDAGVSRTSGRQRLFMEKSLHVALVTHPDGMISLEKQSRPRRSELSPVEGGIAVQNDLQVASMLSLFGLGHRSPKPSPILPALHRNEQIDIRIGGDVR